MHKPFDVSLKDLIEGHPDSWVQFLRGPVAGPVEVINADLATVTAAADKIIRVGEPEPWLLHVELLSSPRSHPAEQLHWYNALLHHRHDLPVRSALVLLHPRANSPQLTGVYHATLSGEAQPYLEFRYRVVRLWEVPVGDLLGHIGTVPLAPLGDVAEAELPQLVREMGQRLATAPPEEARILWTTAYLLSGLRVGPAALEPLYRGVIPVDWMQIMRDSSVVQAWVDEAVEEKVKRAVERVSIQRFAEGKAEGKAEGEAKGKAEEARAVLLRQGRIRFGEPAAATVQALDAITDLPRLERMIEAILTVPGWAELLATP